MARPTKLTHETQERTLEAIRLGLTYKEAAQSAGIGERTFYEWKKKGENAKSGLFLQFSQALKKAEVEGETVLLERIHDAAKGGAEVVEERNTYDENGDIKGRIVIIKQTPPVWQASAWILERRYPERWGRKARVNDDEGNDRFDRWLDSLEQAQRDYEKSQLH